MKFSDNFKENLIHISILNLIFLKIWVFLGIFNFPKNYFSMGGIDKSFFFLEIVVFISLYLVFIFFIKKINLFFKSLFYLTFVLLGINNIRSVTYLEILSIDLNFKFLIFILSFFIILIIFLILNANYLFKLIAKFYNFVGILFFPFFIIIFFKIIFGLVYLKSYDASDFYNDNYRKIKSETSLDKKNLIIWIIVEQLDTNSLLNNIDEFPNINELLDKSDIYTNYDSKSFETIRAVSAVTNGFEKPEKYKFKYNNRNIDLFLGEDKNLKNVSKTKSVFEEYYQKGYSIYVNSWYIPHCRFDENFIKKCFQVPYGSDLGGKILSFYSPKSIFFLHLNYLIPGSKYLSKIGFFENNFKVFDHKNYSFNWYKNNYLIQNENFLKQIKKDDANLIFYQSIIAHPPIFYNRETNSLFNEYQEVYDYLEKKYKDKNIDSLLYAYNYENLYLLDNLIKNISKILKEKKIFDSSKIILHGDTGLSLKIKSQNIEDLSGKTLLLIKNKYQKTRKIINQYFGPRDLYNEIVSMAE